MKSIIGRIRRSLSMRLSIWVTLIVTAIFVAAFSLMFSETRELVRDEALGKAGKTLESTVLHIDNTLHRVEVAANNMLFNIEHNLDNPDMMFDMSRQVLVDNPELTGCSISFEPFYYKEKGRYFSAYSYNDGDSIQTENEGNDRYQYHYMDWYLIPKLLNRPYWIEPFFEDATDGIVVKDVFSSYSQPIHNEKGETVGTFSVDICLGWFSDTVSAAKPYPHSYSILLGKGGTYLVHPDSTKLFYETIFTQTLEGPDSAMSELGKAMLAGESGYKVLTIDGEECFVFYKPFKKTDWSVAIICPSSDIISEYVRLRNAVMAISIVGILLLLIFTRTVIRKNLLPLKDLAHSAKRVADAHFTGSVQESHRTDEIGRLENSFRTMQQSLAGYVGEVRQETENLELRNKELEEAYELAKEDEHMKTAVLHHMTGQMAEPISRISSIAQTIHDEYQTTGNEELQAMTAKVTEETAEVTRLLDQLLKAAREEIRPQRKEDAS